MEEEQEYYQVNYDSQTATSTDFNFSSFKEEYQSQDHFKQYTTHNSVSFFFKKRLSSTVQGFYCSLQKLLDDETLIQELIITIGRGDNLDVHSAQLLSESLYIISKQIISFSLQIESQDNLELESLQYIGQMISQFENLIQLNVILDYNQIQAQGIQAVCSNFSKLILLESLNFVVGWNNNINSEGASLIGQTLKKLNNLKELILQIHQFNNINAEGAIKLAEGIKYLRNLTKLDICILAGNNIGSDGAEALGDSFPFLISLVYLSINIGLQNNINLRGTQGLFQGIRRLSCLKCLSFVIGSFNGVGQEGIIEIANCFKSLCCLKDLQFIIDKNNSIGNKGIFILGESFQYLKNLSSLSFAIDEVYIDYDGIKGISLGLNCLRYIKSIVVILNIDNLMRNQIVQQYIDSISNNIQLKYLICDFKASKSKKQRNKVIRKCLRLVEFK